MKEETIKNEVVGNPNNWHIEVYPRSAGNFGYCSISSIKYNNREFILTLLSMLKGG